MIDFHTYLLFIGAPLNKTLDIMDQRQWTDLLNALRDRDDVDRAVHAAETLQRSASVQNDV
jgi:hypothetical protein